MPDGFRVYIIGDIHGRADLLEQMAQLIAQDMQRHPEDRPISICLGDLVDRGPSSMQILERLGSGAFPTPVLALRGNHEAVLLQFLSDASVLEAWRTFGGTETLFSYGVDVREVLKGQGYEAARLAFLQKLPPKHLHFLQSLRTSYTLGDYFLCHAGVRPGVTLEDQREDDLLWIRDEFLLSELVHCKMIVHGHTPRPAPEVLHNRINLDTGAYLTGRLSCLCLSGETQAFLSTGQS